MIEILFLNLLLRFVKISFFFFFFFYGGHQKNLKIFGINYKYFFGSDC